MLSPLSISVVEGRIESVRPSSRPELSLDGKRVDLNDGRLIVPGFVDSHCHLIGLGLMADRVGLRGAGSVEEILDRVRRATKDRLPGEWVVGFGWNQEEWDDRRMPDRTELDRVSGDNPVVLYRIDSHAAWLNSRALQEAAIAPCGIEGGSIEVNERGEATGILIDNAMALVDRMIPSPTVSQQQRWIEQSIAECLALGITEVHDMNVESGRIESMVRVAESEGMLLRCQVYLMGEKNDWKAFPRPSTLAPNLNLVGVKYFVDGALGSRGALLLEPYVDAPDNCGLRLLGAGELTELALPAIDAGFAIATHAIGDAANRIALDAYESMREVYPEALLRIEHAQMVHPDDLPRFASLDIIAAMQPTHCTSDAAMAEARLGKERCGYAYGWRSLLDLGVPILGGSDFPIESPDPLAGLRAFHFRRPSSDALPWHPEQAISRRDALDAYTTWSPLGIPGRAKRGRLIAGYEADLALLSGDPFDDPDAHVVMTIVGGEILYRQE